MARTLITAGTVYAGDPPRPGPTAVVVEDSRVAWLGPAADVPRPVPRQKVDLGPGAVVIPGLIDSHLHLIDLPLLARWVDCRGVRSREEALGRLRAAAARDQEAGWIVAWGYEAASVEGGRRTTRAQLDEVSADRPVLVMESSFHQGAANSAALAAVGWGRTTPRWPGGELERDRRGEPTGVAWEGAFGVLSMAARRDAEATFHDLPDRYRLASRDLLAQGITHAAEALATRRHLELLGQPGSNSGSPSFRQATGTSSLRRGTAWTARAQARATPISGWGRSRSSPTARSDAPPPCRWPPRSG